MSGALRSRIILGLVACATLLAPSAVDLGADNRPPEPTKAPSYCDLDQCGCAEPDPGYRLIFSCACSSLGQTRDCDYQLL